MPLASLYNIPKTDRQFLLWSFKNATAHTQIINAIQLQSNIFLPRYLIDPIPKNDVQTWLRVHQQVHNDMNQQLSIIGNDLSSVDFENERQFLAWIYLHGEEHRQANLKLGL